MLTHNAPEYVEIAVRSIAARTKNINYELIVVDNHSGWATRHLLRKLKKQNIIDKIKWNKNNLLFAKGNNAGSHMAADDATHYLLINSDVEIRNDNWLTNLTGICPKGGISAYGVVMNEPVRADGYCMLVDSALYKKYELDENYEWFWSITKLQAQALAEGKSVVAVKEHDDMIYHFGGKSGKGFRHAKGMDENHDVICNWFNENKIEILERIEEADFE